MENKIELVDLLKKRANISYKEAKEALEMFNGDIVEALAYFEEQNKIKPDISVTSSSFFRKIKSIIKKSNKIRFIILKNNKTLINVPISIAIIVTIIGLHFVIPAIILALVTGCKLKFEKDNGEGYDINNKIDKVSNCVNKFTNKISDEIKNS
jgi:hypothetical protein